MGTRGAIGFRIDGEDRITYCHYDSYPTGLGADIIHELKAASVHDLAALPDRVRKIVMVTNETPPTEEQIATSEKWTNLGVSEQSLEDWYCILREAQGTLAPYITGELPLMIDSKNFLMDSLFCEWAYIVNLDDGTFEVYKGFNENSLAPGRYASQHRELDDSYYGVALLDTISLSDLVKADTDELVAKWEYNDEDEEPDENEPEDFHT